MVKLRMKWSGLVSHDKNVNSDYEQDLQQKLLKSMPINVCKISKTLKNRFTTARFEVTDNTHHGNGTLTVAAADIVTYYCFPRV